MRNTFNAFRDLPSDYISDLAQSRLGVEPAKLSDIAIDHEVWRVLLELQSPRLSSEEKRTWNEWMVYKERHVLLWNSHLPYFVEKLRS